MATVFSEKLDMLMTLTGTTNSMLARALSFDTSHISRIRRGQRGIPKKQPFMAPAAAYFARKVREEYQRSTLEHALFLDNEQWPDREADAAVKIEEWLSDDARPLDITSDFERSLQGDSRPMQQFFIGNHGKRQAVRTFLECCVSADKPVELLLNSDESMLWLYEDPEFARFWAGALVRIMQKGGRIRIVHYLDRDINEMTQALTKWMPLYMYGSIDSWYCPRIRDGIYRRTCFIAKDMAAVVASSVGDQTEGMGNILIWDRIMIHALANESNNLLALCRPLMQVCRAKDRARLLEVLNTIRKNDTGRNTIVAAEGLQDLQAVYAYLAEAFEAGQDDAPAGVPAPASVGILCQDMAAALVFPLPNPGLAFHITEANLVSAIWQFLKN